MKSYCQTFAFLCHLMKACHLYEASVMKYTLYHISLSVPPSTNIVIGGGGGGPVRSEIS